MRLAGLEPLVIDDDALFVNVGERTNVTGSRAFADAVRGIPPRVRPADRTAEATA